jgi:hypothetical protein
MNIWLCVVTGTTDLVQGYSPTFSIVKKFCENRPLFRSLIQTVKVNTVNLRFCGLEFCVIPVLRIFILFPAVLITDLSLLELTPFPNLQVILRALTMEM